MYLRYRLLHILLIFLTGSLAIKSQEVVSQPDSISIADPADISIPDILPANLSDSTLFVLNDSILLATDSTLIAPEDSILPKQSTLDAPVYYEAVDSIVMTAGNWAYLYGDAEVKYQQIELQAENIEMNMDSSIVFAKFGLDSLDMEFGYPLFIDGGEQYESKTMRYNFKTKRGYITDVITQQGEGYVTSARTKKMEDDVLNMIGGKYTTCDLHEHPHFYIQMTKAKVRPKKNIITGPVYLVIEDVPLPLGLPFAFFPFSESYSSGVIFPSFGDESARGFFLREGGYYFAINDYVDLALTGAIYTKGSWGLSARSSYKKRYKFTGNFLVDYTVTKLGDKGLEDYSLSKDFKINWTHSQDPKANPYRTFSARVDFSTSSYNLNNYTQTAMNPSQTNNSKGSSVNITQRFPNSPFSLSATMTINQTARDTSVAITLPDLTITMSRINPFKRKQRIGKERWYEKISLTYSGALRNYIQTKEDQLFKSNLIKDWQNGMQHTLNTSATFSLLKYINLTTSFNYVERWLTHKVEREYDVQKGSLVPRDTTYGFYRLYNYNPTVSMQTTLYGDFIPMKFMRWTGIQQIRHRLEPSVSFSATPDFSSQRYGYYKYYTYLDADGKLVHGDYSPFEGQIYNPPGRGKSGSIGIGLDNNLEMKVRSDKDSTGVRKISLIDKLSFNTGYNLVADSFQWNNISATLRLKLTKSYTLNLSMSFDPYVYKPNETNTNLVRVSTPRWKDGKGIARLQSTGTSFSYTFNNDTFKKLFGGKSDSSDSPTNDASLDTHDHDHDVEGLMEDEENAPGTSGRRLRGDNSGSSGDRDADGYLINTFPWSLSFSYNMTLGWNRNSIDWDKNEYRYLITHSLSFNGSLQPTKNWRLSFNATYDFDQNKISYMTCNISRNMHCWNMTGSFTPVGNYKYFSFTIAVSSQLLKDLKWDKSASPRDGQTWY